MNLFFGGPCYFKVSVYNSGVKQTTQRAQRGGRTESETRSQPNREAGDVARASTQNLASYRSKWNGVSIVTDLITNRN